MPSTSRIAYATRGRVVTAPCALSSSSYAFLFSAMPSATRGSSPPNARCASSLASRRTSALGGAARSDRRAAGRLPPRAGRLCKPAQPRSPPSRAGPLASCRPTTGANRRTALRRACPQCRASLRRISTAVTTRASAESTRSLISPISLPSEPRTRAPMRSAADQPISRRALPRAAPSAPRTAWPSRAKAQQQRQAIGVLHCSLSCCGSEPMQQQELCHGRGPRR